MRSFVQHIRSRLRPARLYVEWQFVRMCDALLLFFLPLPVSKNSVLVIKLDAIGDLIVWLDVAKELRGLYPSRRITLYVNDICVELANKLPYWDEVIGVNVLKLRTPKYTAYRAHLLCSLRAEAFGTVIQPTYSREFLVGDSLVKASSARERIGSVGDLYNMSLVQKNIADGWYTQLLPANQSSVSELERNAEFLRHLGKPMFAASLPIIPKLADLPSHLSIVKPYFILFPGAGWTGRQWPVNRYAELARQLSRKHNLQAVICGSKSDALLCQTLAETAGVTTFNLVGQTSLSEFVELVRGASLLIGNETSAVHIAGAVNTRAVGILGGGHFGRFMPYAHMQGRITPESAVYPMPCFKCDWQCNLPHRVDGPMPCIERVTVENVMQATERAMAIRKYS